MTAPISPTLEPILRLGISLGVSIDVGAVPLGSRVVIPVLGGAAPGPDIEGTLTGSTSIVETTRADGCTEIDADLTLELTEGGYLSLKYRGFQFGPAEVIESLSGTEEIDPGSYYLRGTLDVSTSVAQFTYLNRALVVTSGSRSAESIVLDAFLVT